MKPFPFFLELKVFQSVFDEFFKCHCYLFFDFVFFPTPFALDIMSRGVRVFVDYLAVCEQMGRAVDDHGLQGYASGDIVSPQEVLASAVWANRFLLPGHGI